MKTLSTAFLVLFITSTVLADGFSSIYSPDGMNVWAVGDGGSVYHSLDGGETWVATSLGGSHLRDVYAILDEVWVVGDEGLCFHTGTSGNTWDYSFIGTNANLHAVRFADLLTGIVVGDNGSIFRSVDGGDAWAPVASPTTENLYCLAYTEGLTVYVAGAAGTVLKSEDGGSTWTMLSTLGSGADIYTIGGSGQTVYVAGEDGFCMKSTDDGQTWLSLDMYTDTKSDVWDVSVFDAETVWFTGGGGYIRSSLDGGNSFSWGIHPLHAALSGIHFFDAEHGWACAGSNNVILQTTDGGATWEYPPGTTTTASWQLKLSATGSIGNTLVVNPWNKDYIYAAFGRFIYMSANRGNTWTSTATISSSSGSTHSFYISPRDTNIWVVAFTGGGDHVRRSTDRGVTWTETLVRNFTSYGMPLEMNPDQPDTLIFAADGTGGNGENGVIYISTDFGAVWDTLAQTTLRSPCDIVVVPESTHIMIVGDGVTGVGMGKIWRSIDGGSNWTKIDSVSGSEIPTVSVSRLRPSDAYATAWSSGGVLRSQDFGKTWTRIATTSSTWGTDAAKDDPNVVVYGSYGTGDSYISTDGGGSFTSTGNNGSNYAYLAYDRATLFAQQSGGVYKFAASYIMPATNAQALVLLSPNGGEEWVAGEQEEIRWVSGNVSAVKIEFWSDAKTGWELVADNVPAGDEVYQWLVPEQPTSEGRVRVSDATDGSPVDSSDEAFSILMSTVSINPDSLSFGSVMVGEEAMDSLRITNLGTGTLVVTSVTTGSAAFVPGRTSFTIEPGQSDTLSVWFSPDSVGMYRDTMVIVTSVPVGEFEVILTGTGEPVLEVVEQDALPQKYVLMQNYPNPFNPETELRYGVPREGLVRLKVYTMLGEEVATLVNQFQTAGWYSVMFSGKDGAGRDLASGLYLYRLEAGGSISTKKMLLIK
jgi:photosystem II stability/assembly factor-like uncharacterized protein